jgi:RecB family exonuclease
VAGDPVLRRGVELVRGRRSERFTRFDGNLSALQGGISSPTEEVVSPTRLEAWAACPLGYLVEHVLGVRVTDDPEELLEISPRDRGELVHAVLEGWLSEMLRGPVPDPSQPWTDAARARLRQIGERCCDDYCARGLTGHPLLWGRDRARILLDLERFCAEDDRRRASTGTRPLAVEVAFGLPTDAGAGPVAVDLPDGRRVAFRGRMDRIDTAGTRLLVTDYKTGGWTDYKGLSEQDPDLGGRRLQLPVYALAARAHVGSPDAPTRAEYWFVSTKGEFKTAGYALTPAVLERFAAVLDIVVRGIEQGVFPAHPKEPGWSRYVECQVCDPDGLGTADRWRDWERKRLDPALAEYLALAEPPTAGAAPGDEAA